MPNIIKSLIAITLLTASLAAQPGLSGDDAVEKLGSRISEVAKKHGMDVRDLAKLLRQDKSLKVDKEDNLFYVCAAPVANKVQQTILPDASDALNLHSLPGATRVIYLDFDGHVTAGTSWNSSYAGGANIVSAPFDIDGNPGSFNDQEKAIITSIWRRVSEDYAPFKVDVTTSDPGVEALKKTSSSDVNYGIRVVISPTNFYNTNAGGVAYIGSFSYNTDTPCFAFAAQLLNHEKYIGEAVAHEVGHTLGLSHDGLTNGTQYYEGHGDWAPIMGVGYYVNTVQFSKGEYANANNTQDDLAVIATHVPVGADDHGNDVSTATPLTGPNVANGGTIETRTDVDYFVMSLGAGQLSLNVTTAQPSANLNAKVELLDVNRSVIAQGNSINAALAAGLYYLKIDGVGLGDPATTGYSDYASLGNYLIVGTLVPGDSNPPPPPPPPPPAEDLAVDVGIFILSSVTGKPGTTVTASIVIVDKNGAAVPNASVTIRWSGLFSGTSTGTTNSLGKVDIKSQKTKKSGTVNVDIISVVGTGLKYDPFLVTEPTTKSITVNR